MPHTRRLTRAAALGLALTAACADPSSPAPRTPVTPTPPVAGVPTTPTAEPDRLLSDAELRTAEDPAAPDVPAAWDAWARANAVPVRSITASDFSDLEFLRPLLAGKRLVQLGESGHGVREFNLAKVRLIQFLHERLGFDVIAFESGLFECHEAGRGAAQADPLETMRGCIFGVWHTQEVLPLFEYLKRRAATDRPLTLAGFDSQVSGRFAPRRAAFLRGVVAAVDTAYARAAYALDSSYFAHLPSPIGSGTSTFAQYTAWVTANQAALVAGYDSLARFLERNDAALARAHAASPAAPRLARQAARSMIEFVKQTAGAGDMHTRDRAMAENVTFLLRELYPDRKVIVWAHNSHIRHNGPSTTYGPGNSMGHWVWQRHRAEMYSVGLYMYRGSAADNSRRVYPVSPAAQNTLEAVLYRPRLRYLFVDMLGQPRGEGTSWMFAPLGLREWGVVGNTYRTPPREQYDGILFIDTTFPPAYL